jgi:hypothetical protein
MRKLLSEKLHEFGVDLLGMCTQYAVRTSLEFNELYILDHFCLPPGARIRRQNTIGVAIQDQCGHIVISTCLFLGWP